MKAVANEKRGAAYSLAPIFTILALGIFAGGIFSYRHYERHFRAEIEQQLSAITELKVAQIVQWRRERLANADYLRRTPYVARRALNVLAQPASLSTRQNFTAALEALFSGEPYEQALVLDERLNVGLVYPERTSRVLSEVALRAAQQALSSQRVVMTDLHRETEDGPVYLSLMVPLVVRRESTGDNVPAAGKDSSPTDRSAGVLVLQVNAHKKLYPLIQHWPTPSRTAETLLVRRDGSDALFLNELRFQTNTALKLRISLASTNVPTVKAVLGQAGIVDGIDYRGESVVASLLAIPDSPWSMVTRMDTAEVYAPLRERLGLTVLLMGALLLGAGASVGMVWRQQRVRFYRERAQAAEALRASEVRYRRLFEAAKDGILILEAETGMVVEVNPFLIELLGFSREQFLGKKVWELGCFKDIVGNQANFAELQEKGYIRYEDKPLETADGRRIEVEFVSNVYGVNLDKVIQCNIRDITERKRAEDQLRQLSRAVEQSPASIVITNPAGDIEYANPKFFEITGYTLAEVLGKNPRVLKSGEKNPESYRELWQTIASGKEWRGEFHNKKKNGQLYWESASISPIRDVAGGITHYLAVKEDITARKQTEAERDQLILDLQKALASVKSLSGLLPICAGCKKIRDDKGYWSQVESYIQKHSEATFTHGLCPDCIKKWYSELGEAGPGDSSNETS